MTINYRPEYTGPTALLKKTLQTTLEDPFGNLFPVHIPIVDLPQEILDHMAPEDRHYGIDVRLLNSSVILCLN